MKKFIAVIFSVLMLCLVFTSCSLGGNVVEGEGTPETEEKGFFEKVEDVVEDVKDFVEDLFGNNDESKESEQTSDTDKETTPPSSIDPDNDDNNWTAYY